MGLKLVTVGAEQLLGLILNDPVAAANQANVLALADDQNLAGKYGLLVLNAPILQDAGGNYDIQRAAPGTAGIPSVNSEGTKLTYSSASIAVTPAATATDFWVLRGSGTKVVRLLRLAIRGIATAAATVEVLLIKRSTDNTGGTLATPPDMVPHDPNDAAATALVRLYTANPSALGTSLGNVRASKLNLGAAGAAGEIVWDFTTRNGKGVVLRAVGQLLVLNWNAAAVPAGTSLTIEAEWSEE